MSPDGEESKINENPLRVTALLPEGYEEDNYALEVPLHEGSAQEPHLLGLLFLGEAVPHVNTDEDEDKVKKHLLERQPLPPSLHICQFRMSPLPPSRTIALASTQQVEFTFIPYPICG